MLMHTQQRHEKKVGRKGSYLLDHVYITQHHQDHNTDRCKDFFLFFVFLRSTPEGLYLNIFTTDSDESVMEDAKHLYYMDDP